VTREQKIATGAVVVIAILLTVVAVMPMGKVGDHHSRTAGASRNVTAVGTAAAAIPGLSSRGSRAESPFSDLPTVPVDTAIGIANSDIKLPSQDVAGEPKEAVVLTATVSGSSAAATSDARSQVGLGVIYPGSVFLSAQPLLGAPFSPSEDYAQKSISTTSGLAPFVDGRAHAFEIQVINGVPAEVEEAGTVRVSPKDPKILWRVPSSVTWANHGIRYLLISFEQPASRLVTIAESVK
jgi:hypothetical protein